MSNLDYRQSMIRLKKETLENKFSTSLQEGPCR